MSPVLPAALALLALATGCEMSPDESYVAGDQSELAPDRHQFVMVRNAEFRAAPFDSSVLSPHERCELPANTRFDSIVEMDIVDDFQTVWYPQGDCGFQFGYIHLSDVRIVEPIPGRCEADISARECAFLATIAYAEGTNERYDYHYSFERMDSMDDHPRRAICRGGLCSTAAGRYQILERTWDGIVNNLSLEDFRPASQDRAALWLIEMRGVESVDAIRTRAEFEAAIRKINREWASLPDSPYGQPTHSMDDLWDQYTEVLRSSAEEPVA